MTATNEADAIAAAREGSIGAFEQLYRMHSARVYGLCLRLSYNRADAQDAAQETFIKAWRALSGFRGECAFATWLHRIAFNEAATIRRKRKKDRHPRHLADRDEADCGESTADVERLEKAIKSLPERARETLVLHKIYGYTHKEIGEFMDIAEGTCKVQVHRALKLLRDIMQTEDASLPISEESRESE